MKKRFMLEAHTSIHKLFKEDKILQNKLSFKHYRLDNILSVFQLTLSGNKLELSSDKRPRILIPTLHSVWNTKVVSIMYTSDRNLNMGF